MTIPANIRTLSKSDFKLARTCDAKLYFRENGYPDNRAGDPYLALLAEGGYMVEALAKAKYPNGVQLLYGGSVTDAHERTLHFLDRQDVTLFEATIVVGRRMARIDILEKNGNAVRLIEVKAKSFDGAEHIASRTAGKLGVFRSSRKPHDVKSDWNEKIEDIAFQLLLLRSVLPGVKITPFLALVDKSKRAASDDIPTLFDLERRPDKDGSTRVYTGRYTGTPEQLATIDLVTEVDVSDEVATLIDDVERAAALFESRLDAPLDAYLNGIERGAKCAKCEFRTNDPDAPNGFAECWGALAGAKPHMLELYSIGKAKAPDNSALVDWMVKQNKSSLLDIPVDGLVKADGTIGSDAARQRRQIDFTRRGEVFVSDALRSKIESLSGPLHFIDFETSRLALPYHQGMRPYGLVAFQWSCHTMQSPRHRPTHVDWLNNSDVWPNQSFAESLRDAIGDHGPVLTWTHFEGTTLRQVIDDLAAFKRDEPGLVEWINDVRDNRIVDLHEWAATDFYHPRMRGRTSIKVVLDALWQTDDVMRQQFVEWTGLAVAPDQDPYRSLPPVRINGVPQDVHEGTGAMRAYQEMMYGADKRNPQTRAAWAELLKQYCALDTLSMVLILEHWRRAVGIA